MKKGAGVPGPLFGLLLALVMPYLGAPCATLDASL